MQALGGLEVTGVAGRETKRMLVVAGLANDGGNALVDAAAVDAGPIKLNREGTITWSVVAESVPAYLPLQSVTDEFLAAFAVWQETLPKGTSFAYNPSHDRTNAMITLSFSDHTEANTFVFDGEGGALACVSVNGSSKSITFDSGEKWELQSRPHHRGSTGAFHLLPVAIHEIGHVLGLKHSAKAGDVMVPFYIPGRLALSANDVAELARLSDGGV